MLEDWCSPADSWLARSANIVLVRGVVKRFGLSRLSNWLWLRQLASYDTPNVVNRFRYVIVEADTTPHSSHCRVYEAAESISQQAQSFSRMLNGEG